MSTSADRDRGLLEPLLVSTCCRLALAPGLPSVRDILLSRALVYSWSATLIRMMHSSLVLIILASALLLFSELLLFANLPLFTNSSLFTKLLLFSDLFLITKLLLIANLLMVANLFLVTKLVLFTDLFLITDFFLLFECTLERVLESEPWLPTGHCPIVGVVLLAWLA